VLRSMKIWQPAPLGARALDHSLARAATLIIGLLVLHSFLDYPLRTSAMMAIMAFACALLIAPPPGAASELEVTSSAEEKRMRRRARQAEVPTRPRPVKVSSRSAAPATISPLRPAELFGEDVNWPAAWRKPPSHVSPNGGAVGAIKPPKS
jgi:hypothetical protein